MRSCILSQLSSTQVLVTQVVSIQVSLIPSIVKSYSKYCQVVFKQYPTLLYNYVSCVGAAENIKEIFIHLARDDCVNKVRKVAYLNAFVKYYKELPEDADTGYTDHQYMLW